MTSIAQLKEVKDDPVVIADEQGLITHVNDGFMALFGWGWEEVVGRPLTIIIPQALRDAHHMGFSRFLATSKTTILNRPLRLKAIDREGREFDAEHLIIAEKGRRGWVFGARIRPLEEGSDAR